MANREQPKLKFIKGQYGNNWKKIREQHKMTVREFSKVVNMSYPSISKIENEITQPTMEQVYIYADKFNASLDYLTGKTNVLISDMQYICEHTGLSESAINFLFKLKEKSEYRAYSDLLSVIITNPKFEYILGLIESCIVSDNQHNKSLDSFSIVEFSDRQLAAFALNQFIPEWLEKISEDFLSSYLSSEFKVNNQIFERLKTKAIEQYNNGEITAEEKYDRMQSIETDFKKKQKELIEKYERILKGE